MEITTQYVNVIAVILGKNVKTPATVFVRDHIHLIAILVFQMLYYMDVIGMAAVPTRRKEKEASVQIFVSLRMMVEVIMVVHVKVQMNAILLAHVIHLVTVLNQPYSQMELLVIQLHGGSAKAVFA